MVVGLDLHGVQGDKDTPENPNKILVKKGPIPPPIKKQSVPKKASSVQFPVDINMTTKLKKLKSPRAVHHERKLKLDIIENVKLIKQLYKVIL